MPRMLPIRDTPWLAKQLEGHRKFLELDTPSPFPPAYVERHKTCFKTDRFWTNDFAVLHRALRIEIDMQWAAVEYWSGSEAAQVRQIYRDAAEAWLAVVADMDFSVQQIPARMGIAQPYRIEIEKAFLCAAAGGNHALGRQLASAYPFPASEQITTRAGLRGAVLRHLLAEEDKQATKIAARLDDGYPVDFPPERIELPLGILRGNTDLFVEGMNAVTTRFNSMWAAAKYKKRHAQLLAKPSGQKVPADWQIYADKVRSELAGLRWLLPAWALAFVNIASWRALPGLADRTDVFSDWIPGSLCVVSD